MSRKKQKPETGGTGVVLVDDTPDKEPVFQDAEFEKLGAEEPLKGELTETHVVVYSHPLLNDFAERGYGKTVDDKLEIAFVEALYLAAKKKLVVYSKKRVVEFKELMDAGLEINKDLHTIYIVYRDLRERGLTVKTGYKFGCHFRVYERGVRIKRGPKEAHEHTKWIVHAVEEDYTCSFPELSRAVRLAHNIRAKMLWAIVDNELDVTYYQIIRIRP